MSGCLEREAVVIETRGDQARVHADRPAACGACKARGACGAQLLDRHRGARGVWVRNAIGAHAGEAVVVSVPTGALLGGALAVYLLPLAGLLGGALLADAGLGAGTPGTVASAAAGLVAGLLAARRLLQRRRSPTGQLSLRRPDSA
ncbi:SoxR reducing system RseC family protein [Halorhodospira halophila]|uniref:SoxR reducing system RseC family protein n=2 Tax=Halorhodospira halophila TaxID=1053 RepID=UPI00191488EC|nr:SoxR reducing system RseC family protein [Halorhodospira halophila]MBK5937183.1 hypothetical protein [Halorhodospira halophila]